MTDRSIRELEDTIERDLQGLNYGSYLALDRVLSAQKPLTDHHDEMLFIIQHQTSELWMKLIIHELRAAMRFIADDDLGPALKCLARVKHIQEQLSSQWSVLATLTPPEYAKFRGALGKSSGFQSAQYRTLEFLLGNKNPAMVAVFKHDGETQRALADVLNAPSLYDEFLRYLARHGHDVPDEVIERDWAQPYQQHPGVLRAITEIYRDPEQHWSAYEVCEELVDVEDSFQTWRFRHLKTVERIIGHKTGTGGSSGVTFLRRALDLTFFPELYAVRSEI